LAVSASVGNRLKRRPMMDDTAKPMSSSVQDTAPNMALRPLLVFS
jgi:hypothetical protein